MTDNEQSGTAWSRRDGRFASRNMLALAALAAVLAVSGCAGPPFSPDSDLTCNSAQQCRVEVAVACAQAACTLSVDHPRVFARGHSVVWIVVNKPGQSYKFADDGDIGFKTAAGRSVFRCHGQPVGGRGADHPPRRTG